MAFSLKGGVHPLEKFGLDDGIPVDFTNDGSAGDVTILKNRYTQLVDAGVAADSIVLVPFETVSITRWPDRCDVARAGAGGGGTVDATARALANADTMQASEVVPAGYTLWALGKHWTNETAGNLTAPGVLSDANILAAGFTEDTGATGGGGNLFAGNATQRDALFVAGLTANQEVTVDGVGRYIILQDYTGTFAAAPNDGTVYEFIPSAQPSGTTLITASQTLPPEGGDFNIDTTAGELTFPFDASAAVGATWTIRNPRFTFAANNAIIGSATDRFTGPDGSLAPAGTLDLDNNNAIIDIVKQAAGVYEVSYDAAVSQPLKIDRFTAAQTLESNTRFVGITDAALIPFPMPPTPADGDYVYAYRKGANELVLKPGAGHTVDNLTQGVAINTDGGGVVARFHAPDSNWEVMGGAVVSAPVPTAILHLTNASSATITLAGDTGATIDWGDGSPVEAVTGAAQVHAYAPNYTGDVTIVHTETSTALTVSGPFDNSIAAISDLPVVDYTAGGGAVNTGPISGLTVADKLVLTGATLPIALGDIQPGAITKRLEVSGTAAITGSPADLPAGAITEDLLLTGAGSAVGGVTADVPAGFATNRFRLRDGTFSGPMSALPANNFAKIVFWLEGNTGVTGAWADIASDLGATLFTCKGAACAITGPANTIDANLGKTTFDIGSLCSISGALADLPIAIGRSTFRVLSSTLTGDLNDMPADIGEQSLFYLETSGTLTCTGLKAAWDPDYVEVYGNMAAGDVDTLIITLAAQSTIANGDLRIGGSNAARTAASDAAVATLQGNGWTVFTN